MSRRRARNPSLNTVLIIGGVIVAIYALNKLTGQNVGKEINKALYPNIPFTPGGYADFSGTTGDLSLPPVTDSQWYYWAPLALGPAGALTQVPGINSWWRSVTGTKSG